MKRSVWGTIVVTAAVCAAPPGAWAKDSEKPVVSKGLGAEIENAVDAVPNFWGSVLVAKEGDVLFAKGYGMADFEKRPCTPVTLYELASVSKQVTATAILHLEQRGKLSTDDTIDRFFKDVPDDKKGITVWMLLTHTASLNDQGVGYADPIPTKKYVASMLAKPLQQDEWTGWKPIAFLEMAGKVEDRG